MSSTTVPVLVRRITDAKAREDRRRLAVQRVLEGETQTAVAQSLKVSLRSVQYWMRRYRDRSEAGLQDVKHPGPKSKLTAAQERTVCSWLAKDPIEFGFRTSLWTARGWSNSSVTSSAWSTIPTTSAPGCASTASPRRSLGRWPHSGTRLGSPPGQSRNGQPS